MTLNSIASKVISPIWPSLESYIQLPINISFWDIYRDLKLKNLHWNPNFASVPHSYFFLQIYPSVNDNSIFLDTFVIFNYSVFIIYQQTMSIQPLIYMLDQSNFSTYTTVTVSKWLLLSALPWIMARLLNGLYLFFLSTSPWFYTYICRHLSPKHPKWVVQIISHIISVLCFQHFTWKKKQNLIIAYMALYDSLIQLAYISEWTIEIIFLSQSLRHYTSWNSESKPVL